MRTPASRENPPLAPGMGGMPGAQKRSPRLAQAGLSQASSGSNSKLLPSGRNARTSVPGFSNRKGAASPRPTAAPAPKSTSADKSPPPTARPSTTSSRVVGSTAPMAARAAASAGRQRDQPRHRNLSGVRFAFGVEWVLVAVPTNPYQRTVYQHSLIEDSGDVAYGS
jgi:hypothetical protein